MGLGAIHQYGGQGRASRADGRAVRAAGLRGLLYALQRGRRPIHRHRQISVLSAEATGCTEMIPLIELTRFK